MDRQIVYPGQIPLETDLLSTNKNTMMALGKLAAAMFGTTNNIVNGLSVVPTSPASLSVNVNAGEIYSLQNADSTAYSSLPVDSTTVVKQGIQLAAVALSCPAPTTAGFSINYLIEATYQDSDTGMVTLPYYNASNPSQAWSGPNNTGVQQATKRAGTVALQAKAGVAAATGTQTTPSVDAGYVALAVVTVANGQATIVAGNIVASVGGQSMASPILSQIYAAKAQSFLNSGAFTVPANVTTIFVSGCAGGGGGAAGGGGGGGTNIYGSGGGGGGAGQFMFRTAYSVTPGQVINITIGAAGNGGAGVVGASGQAGNAGGATVLSGAISQTLVGGNGGGAGLSSTSYVGGGSGGAGYPYGSYGSDGSQSVATAGGGMGGSTLFGGGGGCGRASLLSTGLPGANAFGYGAGGGGGGGVYGTGSGTTYAGGAGGNGAPGIVIVEWN